MEAYMALLIPIVALTIPVIAIWTKHQQKMAEMRGYGSTFDDSALRAQDAKVKALEDRVKVLERIVTDASRGSSLASEIEALRDTGSVPLGLDRERV